MDGVILIAQVPVRSRVCEITILESLLQTAGVRSLYKKGLKLASMESSLETTGVTFPAT